MSIPLAFKMMSLRLRLEERSKKLEIPFSRRQGRSDAGIHISMARSILTQPTMTGLECEQE